MSVIVIWQKAHRAHHAARLVADRHYNRQKIGTPQFVPPGRCCVLYAERDAHEALWVTSWPYAEWVKHAWAGAWVCSAFRNEGVATASILISQAVAVTRFELGEPPSLGMVTFVNPQKVRPVRRRGVDVWGYCFLKAGFIACGHTKGGLLAFQLHPQDMPLAAPPRNTQRGFFDAPPPE